MLGPATVTDEELAAIVSTALGRPVTLESWQVTPVGYESLSPATGALLRVAGRTTDGQDWSIFVKVLQHARHWPMLHLLPPDIRDDFVAEFPWRSELAAWEPGFADRLPAGMRVPVMHRLAELDDDRVVLWMEDVRCSTEPWDVPRYARAARLLGGLAARSRDEAMLAAIGFPPGYGLRQYYLSRVGMGFRPLLADDEVWRHPLVAGAVDPDLRADLRTLVDRMPTLLDRLDTMPQTLPHGDASPQNLLVPAVAPDTLVAIDIAFQCEHAVGFDLGQLLVGRVHEGTMPAAGLADVHAVLVPAFVAGLREHGADVSADDVAFGYEAAMLARAGFTSLPFEALGGEPTEATAELFRERAALTRFIVNRGLALS